MKESVAISRGKLGQPFEQLGGEKNYKWHLECNNYSNQS